MGSLANVPIAEKIIGKKMEFGNDEEADKAKWENPAKKTKYDFAPKLEGNIIDSVKNLADSETKLNHKYSLSLLQLESDPICSSAGCEQYKHPKSKVADWEKDYPVPHFGMDRDIGASIDNMAVAEGIVGHKWPPIDEEKWKNPAKKVLYNYAPKLDGDIVDSQANLAATQKVLDHEYQLS